MTLPIRPELKGLTPYGAPQAEVEARLNVNENPYAPPSSVVDAIAAAVRAAAEGLNRYPDRDFTALRADLAHYLAVESNVDFLEPHNVWAANGSNEVMLHLHQAFGGPGRTTLSFAPTYSMYPEYARDTLTDYVTLPRREDFRIDIDAAVSAITERKPSLVIVASPNNPTGTALALDEVRRLGLRNAARPCRGASTSVPRSRSPTARPFERPRAVPTRAGSHSQNPIAWWPGSRRVAQQGEASGSSRAACRR